MEWIKIEPGCEMPPKFKNVLGYGNEGSMVITCVDSSGKFDVMDLKAWNEEFTHWMPLPKPPKE